MINKAILLIALVMIIGCTKQQPEYDFISDGGQMCGRSYGLVEDTPENHNFTDVNRFNISIKVVKCGSNGSEYIGCQPILSQK